MYGHIQQAYSVIKVLKKTDLEDDFERDFERHPALTVSNLGFFRHFEMGLKKGI